MDFALLGTLSVTRDGVAVPVTGIHQRAVLAYLLLHDNEAIPASRLLKVIWGDDAPRTARKMLQNAVSGLRRLLEAGPAGQGGQGQGPLLLTYAPGYLLQVDGDRIDRNRFQGLADQGRAQLKAGRPAEAVRTLRAALDLWRGDALADLVELGFDWPESAVLRESRTAVLENCLEAELACGRHQEVIGELEMAVAAEPLRERLCGLLMLAAYRSGRQRDALAAYRALRARLVDDLGVDPGSALRELERGILNHDAALAAPAQVPPPTVALPFHRDADTTRPAVRSGPTPWQVTRTSRTASHDEPWKLTVVLVTAAAEHLANVGEWVSDEIHRHGGVPGPGPGLSWCGYFSGGPTLDEATERALTAAGVIARRSVADFPAASVRVALHTGAAVVATTAGGVPAVAAGVLDSCRRLAEAAAPGRVVMNTLAEESGLGRLTAAARTPEEIPAGPFVGRAFESEVLNGLLRRVSGTGRPGLATVIGEAGLGKTRLVSELAVQIQDGMPGTTHLVRATATQDDGGALPVLAALVRDHLGLSPSDGPEEVDRRLAEGPVRYAETAGPGELPRLRRALGPASAPGAASATHRNLIEACAAYLRRLPDSRPTVVIVEDLQWACEGLLDTLIGLAEGAVPGPVMLLATARPEFNERMPRPITAWASAVNLLLDRLPDVAIERLLNAVLCPARRLLHFGPGGAGDLETWRRRQRVLARLEGSPLRAIEYAAVLNGAPNDQSALVGVGALIGAPEEHADTHKNGRTPASQVV
ncbi:MULTISPECIES: BTAD domain-containing putative transcriptional regulator [unclassified Streptomyces]|uniref:BTAD domain-containing putative transcriptional regulator n=1 Tax=unclassified Streptomyces TaxID=2593676 RepID=UPI00381B078F